ncbi:MAG: glucosamine-phosphate N-acetyltransferase [Pseudomonadota bacterium]
MSMNLDVVIMAAGKGTRMKSSLPKVLHPVAGKPMVRHVIDTARQLQARQTIVITGHGAEQVEATLSAAYGSEGLQFARQMPQLGTGHAVQLGRRAFGRCAAHPGRHPASPDGCQRRRQTGLADH